MFVPYPMKLKPTLKTALWGGTQLADSWHKAAPGESVAEAWELTVREKEQNLIVNGAYAAKTLNEVLAARRDDRHAAYRRAFSASDQIY